MKERPLVIITTELPPAMCGIGTYSWLLRTHWPNEWSRVEFLANKNASGATATPNGDRVVCFHGDAHEMSAALDSIGAADLVLHYTGRSYHRLGLPRWMPRVLARWKRKFPSSRVMVMVHELPAQFPITSPHFWLSKLSERITAQLSCLADVLVTNSTHHAQRLRKLSGCDVHLLPIPSNIEIAPSGPQIRLAGEFLIFGLSFRRLQTLRLFEPYFRVWHEAGILKKLHLIGPAGDDFTRQANELIDPAITVTHGELPAAEIAQWLGRVGFGLTNASELTWTQSTTFMAYAASECPVVVATDQSIPHTIRADEVGTLSLEEITRRTRALADWYQMNATWPIVGARMAALWPNES